MSDAAREPVAPPANDGTTAEMPARAPRFSWPMRVFLFVVLFDMIVRSMAFAVPWEEWEDDLGVRDMPRRLPTQAELREIDADPERSVAARFGETGRSFGRFLVPWPTDDVREEMDGVDDTGRFAVVWMLTRLQFFERFVGLDQNWPMYSNVASSDARTRSRLFYADGSTVDVRQTSDPADLTNYSHWLEKKRSGHENKVRPGMTEECRGWCHFLAHRHHRNEAGAELERIELFRVRYKWPKPGEDPRAVLAAQCGPPEDQCEPVFYAYDVARGSGEFRE